MAKAAFTLETKGRDGGRDMRRFAVLFALVACVQAVTQPTRAEDRVALVIGNGAYLHVPYLPNPGHDAEDVGAALRRTGFQTIVNTDLDQTGMRDAAMQFARAARNADVAIFYYSGHAMQYAGVNYLIPIDAELHDEVDLRRMVRVDEILSDLQQAKNLRILVLDSCRDNPLAEELKRSIGQTRSASIERGLARMESPDGTIVSYATQSGRTAKDGDGRNSPYTTAFLKHIEDKDEIATVFHRISANVYESTSRTQVPELSLSFFGEFYLNGKMQSTVAPISTTAPVDPCASANDHWRSVEAINTRGAFEDHLARFPNCAFAGLARDRIEALKTAAIGPTQAPVPASTRPLMEQQEILSPPQTGARLTDDKPPPRLTASGRPILEFGSEPAQVDEKPPLAKLTAAGRPVLEFGEDKPAPITAKPSGKLTATGRPILEFGQD
jgi:hypothetical protein